MSGLPAGSAGVVLVYPVVRESKFSKAGLELEDIGDLPVELSHVAEVIEADDTGHCTGCKSSFYYY